ncbi:hypothetical protein SSP24_05990 [Streptomyces spinoverrucosus]|uniref:Uncharacterized protein n=1 Tax=Streptomyces spinoverrucosus TaxID=284043 RepID=A0A4Y3V7Y3_9ACTN|nr:hypothetical protein [Streptomyces spinoverrucosus]GEC02944.1 hypothetical protein SSP24_05990 [Streptomyces spinoverrucosus]GHB39400.1 hypothetical protein GCM10010397_06600 [Streptomyces spinoverrucosus]
MTAPPEPPNGVVIRSREVWDKLCAVENAVNEIRSELKTTVKDHGKQLDDLTQRVRALEEARWRATGAGAVLGAAASLAVQFLAR